MSSNAVVCPFGCFAAVKKSEVDVARNQWYSCKIHGKFTFGKVKNEDSGNTSRGKTSSKVVQEERGKAKKNERAGKSKLARPPVLPRKR